MNDQRFDSDLLQVLRDAAGEEAPMSLRQRLSRITDQAPVTRRLWFAPPPLQLSLGVVAVAAILVLALLFMPRESVGPMPTSNPTATATPAQSSAAPTPGGPTDSSQPSDAPTLQPTTEPTSVPSPALSDWTGIQWSSPFAPFPHQDEPAPNGTSVKLHAILPWNGAYIAAGSVSHGFQCEEAAFFRSEDGIDWTTTATFSSRDAFAFYMCPDFIVPTSTGLLAIGQQRLWASADGAAWTEVESASWRELWLSGVPQLLGVASGPGGVVAIGVDTDTGDSSGVGLTVVAHSTDGSRWDRVSLPAQQFPIARDIVSYAGGFVVVGRDGEPDGEASLVHPAIVPGLGRAAAWTSRDGVTWKEASVEADLVQGGGMSQVLAGSAGLFAIGLDTDLEYYPSTDYEAGAVVPTWTSVDGSVWEASGAMGADLPPMSILASDGRTMVGFGLDQSWASQDPSGWASADGRQWSPLSISGPAPYVNYLVLEPMLLDSPADAALWVLPQGILALGYGEETPANEPWANQWFRFGTAVVP